MAPSHAVSAAPADGEEREVSAVVLEVGAGEWLLRELEGDRAELDLAESPDAVVRHCSAEPAGWRAALGSRVTGGTHS